MILILYYEGILGGNSKNLWHNAEPLVELETLRENVEADVTIIGGGYTGLSTALHLADLGKQVVVLEAQDVGHGASGRNVGLTNAGLWIMPNDTIGLLGKDMGGRLNKFLINAPQYVDQLITENKLDCDYKRNGTLHLAHSPKAMQYLEQRREQLVAYGADVRLLDQKSAYQLTQAKKYHGALQDTNAGILQPLKYCQELAKLALKKGVRIFKQSAAVDIEATADEVIVKTKNAMVRAGQLVLATNAYEQYLTHNSSKYTPLYYCQLASKPLSAEQLEHCLPSGQGVWDSGMVMRSFRLDVDNRLIVGTVGNIHTQDARMFKQWSAHVVAKTFPHIGALKYEYAWAGRIAKSHNNIPQISQIEANIYQIMGYSGRGIAPATVTGKMMAGFLCGNIPKHELPLPLNKANNISFNKLRAAIYEMGSQLSHMSDFIIR